jgi:hypothetical protein
MAEGYRSGADLYLIKPAIPGLLLEAIESTQRGLQSAHEEPMGFNLSQDLPSLGLLAKSPSIIQSLPYWLGLRVLQTVD